MSSITQFDPKRRAFHYGTVELTPTVRPDDEVVQIIVDSGGRPLASDVDLLAIGVLIQKGPNSDPNRYLREFFEHNGDRFDLEPNANWNWGKTR